MGAVSSSKIPWLDHTAIAALTGARPEELRTAKVLGQYAHIYPNINADTDYLGIGIFLNSCISALV